MIQRVLLDLSDQNSRLHFYELSIILIISDENVDKILSAFKDYSALYIYITNLT